MERMGPKRSVDNSLNLTLKKHMYFLSFCILDNVLIASQSRVKSKVCCCALKNNSKAITILKQLHHLHFKTYSYFGIHIAVVFFLPEVAQEVRQLAAAASAAVSESASELNLSAKCF